MSCYLIRLDDACPTMHHENWNRLFTILDTYKIKPIVAVVPQNEDTNLCKGLYKPDFWDDVKAWKEKGYHIAMHGYNHVYTSSNPGLVPINNRSEFAGVDIETQRKKIRKSREIFNSHQIIPEIWVGPAHSFDVNTLTVLKEETEIKIISDGIAFFPYYKSGFLWLPQQLWKPKNRKKGIWTLCLHPNDMKENDFILLEQFIAQFQSKFNVDLHEVIQNYKTRRKNISDYLFTSFFFLKLKLSKVLSS